MNLYIFLEYIPCGNTYYYDFMDFSDIYADYKMNQKSLNICMSVSTTYFMTLYRVIGIKYFNQRKQRKIILRIWDTKL